MPLKITNREVNGASVLALEGRIVLGAEGDALREELQTLVHDGKKELVLNMNNIEYIDSAELGTLIEAHFERQVPGRFAQALPPAQQASGSPANHPAGDGIPGVQHRSSRGRELLCLKTAKKTLGFARWRLTESIG